MDTAQWLTLQRKEATAQTEAPVDIAINWNSLGGSATRLRYVSAALSDIALKHGDIDLVVGIATSGVPAYPFSILKNTEPMQLTVMKELSAAISELWKEKE